MQVLGRARSESSFTGLLSCGLNSRCVFIAPLTCAVPVRVPGKQTPLSVQGNCSRCLGVCTLSQGVFCSASLHSSPQRGRYTQRPARIGLQSPLNWRHWISRVATSQWRLRMPSFQDSALHRQLYSRSRIKWKALSGAMQAKNPELKLWNLEKVTFCSSCTAPVVLAERS